MWLIILVYCSATSVYCIERPKNISVTCAKVQFVSKAIYSISIFINTDYILMIFPNYISMSPKPHPMLNNVE